MINELHVVFGASGGIGNALVKTLVREGKSVRAINRKGNANVPEGVENKTADLLNLDQAVKVSEGATHIYNCVNVSYEKWTKIFPSIVDAFIELLKSTKAKGIIIDNLYMYGENVSEPMREDMSYNAHGKKGKLRGDISKKYEVAMDSGEINALICRGPDFYGPGVTYSSFYGERIFPNILAGKGASVMGKLDQPHAIIYVYDFAKALVTLATDDAAYGQIWHTPSAPALTQGDFLKLAYEVAETKEKVSTSPKIIMKMLGLFVPIVREVNEMFYEFEKPYIVDSSKFESKYGNDVTPHREALKVTLNWYRTEYSKK